MRQIGTLIDTLLFYVFTLDSLRKSVILAADFGA